MLASLINQLGETRVLGPEGPLKAYPSPGTVDALVIAGENASGKSVVCSILERFMRKDHDIVGMHLGMHRRTQEGLARAFIYGSDQDEATGVVSLNPVLGGISNAVKAKEPRALILDEPDLGLSVSYARALGRHLAHTWNEAQKTEGTNYRALVLVTHNRELAKAFVESLEGTPHFIHMETDKSLADWLKQPEDRSIEELLALPEKGRQVFLEIKNCLKD